MRTSFCLVGLLLLAGTPGWGQNFYYLPTASDGATGDGSVLRTSVLIVNPGVRSAHVSVSWTNDDGSSRSASTLTLTPGATQVWATDGTGDGSGAAATIGSDVPVQVWGVRSTFDSSGTLRSETSFAAAATSTGFRVPVDASSTVALFNPGPADASITASLVDSNGAAVGSESFTLAAGARVTRPVSTDLQGLGTLDLTSSAPIATQLLRAGGAILEASPLAAKRMKYYFARLADGPSINATLRTTFLVTNLSKKAANVTLALTREDGSPWIVVIPGMDPASTLQTILAPGSSVALQTDGSGPYAAGSATVQADSPVSVQAVVTAVDSQGTLLSETAVPDARLRSQFTIPFDVTSDLISGAAFYNPGSQPVTIQLSLVDGDGQVASTTPVGPIPPNGQVAGLVTDLFPGTSVMRGTLIVTAADGFLSTVGTRQNQNLAWPSALPAGAIPLNGVPIAVVTSTDDKRAATASIGPKGGALSLSDASGNKFTLTIPPNALLGTEKIVMTPVTAAKGVPGSGLVAVQLAPDGLALLQPATLAIQSASAATLTPIGWYGSTNPGVYLNLLQSKSAPFTMLISHFSNAGGANLAPGDLTAVLLNIIDLQAFYNAQAAVALKAQNAQGFADAFEAQWDQVIEPLIQAALSSQDDNVIQCAIYHALAYERQLQLLGADPKNVISAAIETFMADGRHILIEHAKTRCTQDHDFTALMDILTLLRQDQLLAGNEPLPDYTSLQTQCPYKLQYEFSSLMLSHYPGAGYFKGVVSANFPVSGTWDKTVLNSVTDPTVDLYASYELSGSGNATYNSFTFETEDMEGCTIVANGLRPGKVNVAPEQPGGKKSQVQFMFSSAYDPSPYSQSGVQLCAFCPVYRKKLQKVDVLMNPGLNWEDITDTCPLVGAQKFSDLFWNDSWDTVHPADPTSGLYFFPNWNLVLSQDLLAQVQSILAAKSLDHDTVESTTMVLRRIP